MKTTFLSLLLLLTSLVNAQCPYPAANTQNGTTQTFCVNNPNQVITINNMNGTRFLLVNVIQGFTYNFSVGNVYASNTENLNVYNAATNSSLVFASGASGASISNWVSTFSGQIKIVLSLDACVQSNTTNVSIVIEIAAVGNTFDNQNNFGTDNWVGHVYNWLGNAPPPGGTSPTSPSNTYPFDSSGYIGYYNIGTEGFIEGFGGDYTCFPVFSNGTVRTNILTDVFAVRYKMKSTRPAGCYIATFRGDDGIRLYNDGVLVFDRWVQQGPTNYNNVLIYLDGSADLILDYYEYNGQNVADFSLTPFNNSLNTIATPINPIVCSGVTPAQLDGTTFSYNGSAINPTIAFQWQSSTNNSTFTNISGATNEDYSPPAVTATSANIVIYYRRIISAVSNSGGCNFPSNSVSITTTAGGGSSTPPIATVGSNSECSQLTANWNPRASASSYILDVSTSSSFATFVSGYNGLNVGNVTNYLVTGLTVNTTYYYRLRAVYSCGISNTSNIITYSTLTLTTTPTATAATAVSCNQFTANWNAATSANSYTLDVATSIGFTAGTFLSGYNNLNVGNVTSYAITGITVSPIYYRIKAVGSCNTSGDSNIITVNTFTTTWNGSVWSNGSPTLSTAVIINGNYDTTTLPSFDACSVTVNSPFVLNVVANKNINIQNQLTTASGATFTLQNDASLVQINNNAINSGNINVFRNANIRLQDYVYWSSPVENFPLLNVSPNTPANYFWKWNTAVSNTNGGSGNWQNTSEVMSTGKGYIVRGPNGWNASTPTIYTTSFVGKPNNGIITASIERGSYTGSPYMGANGTYITKFNDNWNLVGNPYPSAINANSFLTTNTNIVGAVILWTHATLPTSNVNQFYNSFVYNYVQSDYLIYNATAASNGPNGFNGYIGSGQSFFVVMDDGAATTSTVTFNNAMRSKSYDNSQFYKGVNEGKSSAVVEKHRIWLDLVSPSQQAVRAVIGYIEGATDAKDRIFDAYSSYKPAMNLYSLIDDEIMSIQGKSLPFLNSDTVPLGIKVPTNGTYTIAIAATDGLFENGNQIIYLEDKKLNVIHNLNVSPYQFDGVQGVDNDRFHLRYTDATLSNSDFNSLSNTVSVSVSENNIKINSSQENIKSYTVYDVLGRTVISKNSINFKLSEINSILKNNQALIVKVILENDQVVTKKIVF